MNNLILLDQITAKAKSTIRKFGFNEDVAEELAGDVLLYLLEKIDLEYGRIPNDLDISSSEIYYATLRIIERGKQTKEHNLADEAIYHSSYNDGEFEDPLEARLDQLINDRFIIKFNDGCDWFNNILEEVQEKPNINMLELLVGCFGEDNRILLKLYLEWLYEGHAFSKTSLANFLGITKQGVGYKLKCLNANDVQEIIKLATEQKE